MTIASVNWLAVILIFIAPLVLSGGLIIIAFRSHRKWACWIAATGGAIFLVVFLVVIAGSAPYFWALHLESKWFPANPKTKVELESYLSLYSKREIQPSESGWGSNHHLQAGERMTQYLLLWSAPLDVVYTSDDRVVAVYTSYE